MYIVTINLIALVRPGFLPKTPRHSWAERLDALNDVWAVVLLFIFIIGGLYAGMFTATEAAGMGASGAFIIAVVRRKLSRADFWACLIESLRTTAAVFTILIGALIFGYFLTITQTPQKLTAFLTGLGLGPYGVLVLILLMYLVLGCIMDAMAMIILTVPIVFPVIQALGFDPIWFGVIIVMTVELGPDPPAGGHERFRHQERYTRREAVDGILWGDAVRAHRHCAAGHHHQLPDLGHLAALAYVSGSC